MKQRRNLRHLKDSELVAGTSRLARQRELLTADLIAHIAEMDERRLYREHACSSMFAYATQRLHLSEAIAYKYIHIGRLARRFPLIFDLLEAGDTHLSNLALLAPHLDRDNHRDLLSAVRHLSKRRVEILVAERFPKPPVEASMRKLPARRAKTTGGEGERSVAPVPGSLALTAATPAKRGKVTPLAPAQFKVVFTADQELSDNIDKARALLGPSMPRGELSELFGLAMRELVAKLEKKKFAKTSRPRRTPAQARPSASANDSQHVPNHVKREVAVRDDEQCTFVDADGNRCQERWGLEYHHEEVPFALGGPPTVQNLTLHCKAHNALKAERDYGVEFVAAKKAAAKQAATKRAATKKAATKRAATKKAATKRAATKRAATKKAATKKAATAWPSLG